MKMRTGKRLALSGSLVLLAACNGNSMMNLSGSIASVAGSLRLTTNNGDEVALDASSAGRGVTASFYDYEGRGAMSIRFAGEVDPFIVYLDQNSRELANGVVARSAHGTASSLDATVDLTAGPTVPVHAEWDGTDQCIYWQGYVTKCDGARDGRVVPDPRDRRDHEDRGKCHQVLETVYGTATFHFVKSGNIFHDDLKLAIPSGTVVLDLVKDDTHVASTQISPCFRRPDRY